MPSDLRSIALDPSTVAKLARRGLAYRVVDVDDLDAFAAWSHAGQRGFHHAAPTGPELESDRTAYRDRIVHGVYDASGAQPDVPVATVASWPAGLSMPGDRSVDAWAIASVTVAPTHRRRGIARAMLTAELRGAKAAGAALAMLTATEATLYGRYGFAPAARTVTLEIDPRRVEWSGPDDGDGRVHFVPGSAIRRQATALVRKSVARTPGEIDRWPALLDEALGLAHPESLGARAIRVARYDDAAGRPQGFVTYRVTREADGPGVLEVGMLVAATDAAERALWRFVLEQDYVRLIRARRRSVDEPLRWLLADPRAITMSDVQDHLWLRVLDPVAALGARRYTDSGSLVIEIDDPLGYASGRFELEVSGKGQASVRPVEVTDVPTRAARRSQSTPAIRLGVAELASILLGDTRPTLLARAGRIQEQTPGSAAAADRLFAWHRAPQLTIVF